MISKRSLGNGIAMSGQLVRLSCLVTALIPFACSKPSEQGVETRVPRNLEIMTAKNGHAIGGYDAVSYHLDGEPRMGAEEYSFRWRDVTWLFATAAHRDLFRQNPSRYAPAYGGWCAYGMADGYAAESDPLDAWTIHGGKLYLNWDAEVAEEWRADRDRLLLRSEENWPEVKRDLQNETAEIYWHDAE